ncbi:hypothetical protein MMC25_002884 [Agyrium rufum]|nr:hypothetical protein [Agyrium rufum]
MVPCLAASTTAALKSSQSMPDPATMTPTFSHPASTSSANTCATSNLRNLQLPPALHQRGSDVWSGHLICAHKAMLLRKGVSLAKHSVDVINLTMPTVTPEVKQLSVRLLRDRRQAVAQIGS